MNHRITCAPDSGIIIYRKLPTSNVLEVKVFTGFSKYHEFMKKFEEEKKNLMFPCGEELEAKIDERTFTDWETTNAVEMEMIKRGPDYKRGLL